MSHTLDRLQGFTKQWQDEVENRMEGFLQLVMHLPLVTFRSLLTRPN